MKIAVPCGDPAGIGLEISLAAFADRDFANIFFKKATPVFYTHSELIDLVRRKFFPQLRLNLISNVEDATAGNLNVIHIPGDISHFKPGEVSAECGKIAYDAILKACDDAKAKNIDVICTGPINKQSLKAADIDEIGHTEILAKALDGDALTLFVTNRLRIFFFTRHLSLKDAVAAVRYEPLRQFVEKVHQEMFKLGYKAPKLGLAALNPHASDGGRFGNEENDILFPLAAACRRIGIDISDPIGADSVFAMGKDGVFDAVLSLYHDQGHIAAKTYDFHRTISATLGLPVLRTSVDHGTAFDIAWQNKADALSMKTALMQAADKLGVHHERS